MKRHTYTAAYRDESRLFYIALTSFLTVFSLYIYFVSSSIVSVVMREEVDSDISVLSTKVGQLEAEYIEKQHAVSSDIAEMRGFVMADKKIFIDRTTDTLVLSRN